MESDTKESSVQILYGIALIAAYLERVYMEKRVHERWLMINSACDHMNTAFVDRSKLEGRYAWGKQ